MGGSEGSWHCWGRDEARGVHRRRSRAVPCLPRAVPAHTPMMIAALAVLLLLLVICDPGWREGAVKTPALSPFLAFTQEHAHCQGGREYGATDGRARWAACPCGAYLEARLEVPWPWLYRLAFTLGRWSVRLEATLWIPVIQAARRISAWRCIALGWLRRQLALLGAR